MLSWQLDPCRVGGMEGAKLLLLRARGTFKRLLMLCRTGVPVFMKSGS